MSEITSITNPYITQVVVEGLHGQFDVDVKLGRGLNVIYGKNGRGKTTMLHLLANLLELDFSRFRYLYFRKISITTSSKDIVELEREEGAPSITISLNGSPTGSTEGLSPLELSSLRSVLGGRATYLPAFRSVLERSKRTAYGTHRYSEGKEDIETIYRTEFLALKEASADGSTHRQLNEDAYWSAEKTLVCRHWFGQFVPIIRYPSISDVEDALSEEWRRAQVEVTTKERRMFEETFVKVFKASAGLEQPISEDSTESILQEISELLEKQELAGVADGSKETNQELLRSARQLVASPQPSGGVNKSLLEIYRKALREREDARSNAFARSREIERSINKFLDKKKLSIGRSSLRKGVGARNLVSISTEAGGSYGMSALSSGERQIVTMLYSANRTKFTSGLFLIDEPELSLHIDWQRIILRELIQQAPDRQIIVCTHSPEVGADHLVDVQDFEPAATQKRQASLFDDGEVDDGEED